MTKNDGPYTEQGTLDECGWDYPPVDTEFKDMTKQQKRGYFFANNPLGIMPTSMATSDRLRGVETAEECKARMAKLIKVRVLAKAAEKDVFERHYGDKADD